MYDEDEDEDRETNEELGTERAKTEQTRGWKIEPIKRLIQSLQLHI